MLTTTKTGDDVVRLCADIVIKNGDAPIKGKTWQMKIDEHWSVTLNATTETIDHILPGHFDFSFNGFPAGMVSIMGEGVIAAGAAANIDTLCEALEKKLESIPC